MTTHATRTYPRSPIAEISCEFEFAEHARDSELQGRFFARMRANYPRRPKPLNFETTVVGRPAHVTKMLLSTGDELSHVRLGENSLSVHTLAPYPGWQTFRDRVEHALRVYLETAQPKLAMQVNLHYRNVFLIPAQSLLMADYFNLGATIPHGFPTRLISFVTALRSAYDEDPHKVLSLSLTATPPEREGQHAVEATLEIMTSNVKMQRDADLTALLEVAEDLRLKAAEAFEGVITDRTRALFR